MKRHDYTAAQRYACAGCGTERVLPESPTTGPRRVRAGCEACGRPTVHRAVGRSDFRVGGVGGR